MIEKMFPIHPNDREKYQGRIPDSIPFRVIEPHNSQAISNHSQTLKRLAERGGLGLDELYAVMHDLDYFDLMRGKIKGVPIPSEEDLIQFANSLTLISPEDCAHQSFDASVSVARLTNEIGEITSIVADVKISCRQCNSPFHFIGVPAGFDPSRPTVDVFGTELHAPIGAGQFREPARSSTYIVPQGKIADGGEQ